MSGWESASREELLALVAARAGRIEELTARVAELERRLAQNSRNSSRPPSADPVDAAPGPPRRGTGRRPGKQPGSPGTALRQVDDPDEVVEHVPAACAGCGADLADAAVAGVVRRQVHDIPQVTTPGGGASAAQAPPPLRVRDHRGGTGGGGRAPACYRPNLRALVTYLVVFQHVPVERAAALSADVTGAGCSTGWICGVLARTAETRADLEKLIKTPVTRAQLVHAMRPAST